MLNINTIYAIFMHKFFDGVVVVCPLLGGDWNDGHFSIMSSGDYFLIVRQEIAWKQAAPTLIVDKERLTGLPHILNDEEFIRSNTGY